MKTWRLARVILLASEQLKTFSKFFSVHLFTKVYEPFVQVKQSFSIGAGVVTSFGYRKDVDGQWIRK